MTIPRLSRDQAVRYSRQTLLAEVGGAGQSRLLAARVLVRASTGTAARTAATYLVAAGVGEVVLEGVPGQGGFGWGAELATLNPEVRIVERAGVATEGVSTGLASPADAPERFDAVVDFAPGLGLLAGAPTGPAAAVHGAFLAAEALKRILGAGEPGDAAAALAEAAS